MRVVRRSSQGDHKGCPIGVNAVPVVAPPPLPEGDRKGPHPTPLHSRPYKDT
jgi:hypothetical protein